MTTPRRMSRIRLTEYELVLILTLIESCVGGPTWRHNERDGWKLLGKIEDHLERALEQRKP
jgi:hypothetical protein